MNRKSFLKKLGAGALIAAVAPKAIAWKEPKVIAGADPAMPGGNIMFAIDVSCFPNRMTAEEFIKEWRKDNGSIIYRADGTQGVCIPAPMSNVRILRGKEAEENYAKAAD